MEHFAIRIVDTSQTYNGYIIVVETDVPCHLWLRLTTKEPQIHDKPVLRRGLRMHGDRYFCFVAYEDNEQSEPGDTLLHTFIKLGWKHCQTYYFYFLGTIINLPIPSTSAIHEIHFEEETAPPFTPYSLVCPALLPNRTAQKTSINWLFCRAATSGTILDNYDDPYYLIVAGVEVTASFWIHRGFLFFDTSELPNTATIVGARLAIYVYNSYWTSSEIYPNLCITQGVQHDPVIPTDYGDQLKHIRIGAYKRYDELTPGAYHNIHFIPRGFMFINYFDITTLCLRSELDFHRAIPPLGTNQVFFYSAQKGDGFLPILTIDYTLQVKPPRARAWWEPWGTYVDQFNQWGLFHGFTHDDLTFTAGVIKIVNPGIWDGGIATYLLPMDMPCLAYGGRRAHLVCNFPSAHADTSASQLNIEIWLRKGNERFQIALSVARGVEYGPWGELDQYTKDYIWRDMGIGPKVIDLIALFSYVNLELDLGRNVGDWNIETIAIALGVRDSSENDYLHCDYLGLDYR